MPRKRLGMRELEAQVMNILWEHEGPLTPREVHDRLPGDRPLAYTTVMTVLVRLWKKQIVSRSSAGKAFAYAPTQSRAEYSAARMRDILEASGNRAEALASFVSSIEPKDRTRLRSILTSRPKR